MLISSWLVDTLNELHVRCATTAQRQWKLPLAAVAASDQGLALAHVFRERTDARVETTDMAWQDAATSVWMPCSWLALVAAI